MAKQMLKQKKKKKWFSIYSPSIFNNQFIGQSFVESSENLKGKFMSANLATVTNDMKRQNVIVRLRVNKIADGQGHTEMIGLRLVQGYVKRLVRRGRSKVDDSFTVRTKEKILVRVKPLIITTNNCVRSTATDIRLKAQELLKEKVASQAFMKTAEDILSIRLQREMKEALNKIFPIKSVDIRVFEREPIRGQIPQDQLQDIIRERAAPKVEKPKTEQVAVTDKTPAPKSAKAEPVKKAAPVEKKEVTAPVKEPAPAKAEEKPQEKKSE